MARKNIVDGAFLATLETLEINIRTLMNGWIGGNHRSKLYGTSAEFTDYREYHPGDDLRHLDWNLYGRFDKLFLKLFLDERQLHHHVYLDASASMEFGEPVTKSYAALRMAAALGFLSVQAMDRVSFFALRDNRCENLSPEGQAVVGREAFYRMTGILNRMRFEGDNDLFAAITACEQPGYANGTSFIISDFMTDSSWKDAVDFLLYRKREVVLIQPLSRGELMPTYGGKTMLLDAEAPSETDGRNMQKDITKSAVKAYLAALAYHQKDILDFCNSRSVPFLTFVTDESIEELLYRQGVEQQVISSTLYQ